MTPTTPSMRIGCAGWSIASHQRSLFDAGDSMLARYATRLNAVEINSSFYRSHQATTYARWASSVPAGFRFAVKLPQAITHDARLQKAGDALARFVDEVSGLGRKLGVVLVQLPPSLVFDARVASTFFAMLERRLAVPVACEPRHASWFDERVEALWQRRRIARVAADPARLPAAAMPGLHGRVRYWRWHGSPRMYYSAYDDARLSALAEEISAYARRARPAWCIFDNTAHGHAVEDALRLQAQLHAVKPTPRSRR